MTIAANDIATFIDKFTNGKSTIVYGMSYGTGLVGRLMHLKTQKVIGDVLDGFSTTSATTKNKFPFISVSNLDFGEVADTFLDLCVADDSRSRHFKSKSLPD